MPQPRILVVTMNQKALKHLQSRNPYFIPEWNDRIDSDYDFEPVWVNDRE